MSGNEGQARVKWSASPLRAGARWMLLCCLSLVPLASGACAPADPGSPAAHDATNAATPGAPGAAASTAAKEKCNKIKPPKKKDEPDFEYVSVMANSYVAGGVMISVHVNEPVDEGPGFGKQAEVRVWADTNTNPSTARPPTGSDGDRPSEGRLRARTPEGWWDLSQATGVPWAGSTIVRAATTETVWVYVEVKLCISTGAPCNADGSGTTSTQNKRYWMQWHYDASANPPQWVPDEQDWVDANRYSG